MSLTLSDFRRLLRRGLGNLTTGDMSNPEADELLNLSLWHIEDTFPFELKEVEYTTSLVDGQAIYNLSGISTLDAIVSVRVEDEFSKYHRLDRMTRTEYNEMHDGSSDAEGFPKYYLREGNAMYLEPTPGADEDTLTLAISLKESLDSFLEGSSEASNLPRNWDEIVLQGAIWRGHNLNRDYELRDSAYNLQQSLIRGTVPTESKEEEDSHHAGLDVKW